MARGFIACDREQSFLMPPDVREWLPEDHFAWFVLAAVEAMNLDAFYAAYRVDGRARPAYEPSVIVAVLLYAYARGVRSSRRIERACVEDVAYRVVAAQQKPDHATLARFVERHQSALAEVFGGVLELCAKAGLVGVNVVAVDGSKVSANASREATVDYERLAREVLEEAQAIDAEEDERLGDRRGDELPPEVATSAGRRQWFKEASRWLDDQRAEEAAPISRDRPKRVKEAKRRMDEQLFTEMRAEEAYQRYRAKGKDRRGGRLGPNTVPGPTRRRRFRRARSTRPTWTPGWSRASTGGCRATTPKPQPTNARSSSRPRSRSSLRTSDTWNGSSPRPAANSKRSASPNAQERLSRTPATGIPSRCNGSPPTASRF